MEQNAKSIAKAKDDEHKDLIKFFCAIDPRSASLFATTYYDRSGIFVPGESTIPLNTYTNKTFEQIVDERAVDFILNWPTVLWSGGIDSTTILAAFIKNKLDFEVTVDGIQAEQDLIDFVNNNCVVANVESQLMIDRFFVTGSPCDQLYPSIQHSFDTSKLRFKQVVKDITDTIPDYFKSEVPDSIKFISSKDWFIEKYIDTVENNTQEANRLFDKYITSNLSKFPVAMGFAYQMKWFVKFVIKYQLNINATINKRVKNRNIYSNFYDTEDFQRWAITNLDYNYNNYSNNYLTYKMPNKQYSYDVIKLDSVLTSTKLASDWGPNLSKI